MGKGKQSGAEGGGGDVVWGGDDQGGVWGEALEGWMRGVLWEKGASKR